MSVSIIMMKINDYYFKIICVLCLNFGLTACGEMYINETHYYAVERPDNVNVFRLRVEGYSLLSDAKYQAGWYPRNAVDSLYGTVRSNSKDVSKAREKHEALVSETVYKAAEYYSSIALKPDATETDIEKALQVRRRALYYPSLDTNISENARIIDFNPSIGVAVRHSDEKMVFILSSDPDSVVGNIKNFAESEKTSLSVDNLAVITSQRVYNDVIEAEAKLEVDKSINGLISSQLDETKNVLESVIEKNPTLGTVLVNTDGDMLIDQLNILIGFLEGVQQ